MYQQFTPAAVPEGRLILYFSGWGMTPVAVEHLERPEGYDLLSLWYSPGLWACGPWIASWLLTPSCGGVSTRLRLSRVQAIRWMTASGYRSCTMR